MFRIIRVVNERKTFIQAAMKQKDAYEIKILYMTNVGSGIRDTIYSRPTQLKKI